MAGNKNSGRRTTEEEIAYAKDKLKDHALEELAETKLYCHLENVKSTNKQGIKNIALPIYLKSKADKKEFSGELAIITGTEVIKDET